MSVAALEAEPLFNAAQDFATDELAQQKLFWQDERLNSGSKPIAFGAHNSGVGVGGSTLHYTAYVPRAQPDDFQLYSEFGVGINGRWDMQTWSRTTTSWNCCWVLVAPRPTRGGQSAERLIHCLHWV